jgi:hypothetical protein
VERRRQRQMCIRDSYNPARNYLRLGFPSHAERSTSVQVG